MNNLNRYILLAGAAGGALISPPSHAQDSQSAGVEEVVVTARRVQEKLQDVPVAVTAFTSKDLEEKQINSIQTIGQGVPNVWIQATQLGTAESPSVTIRGVVGVPNNIATDSPIGVYIDGVYMAGQVGLAIAMTDLDQFEVLRGPQGTLLGKNTVGGALSMTTKAPSGVLDGHLEMGFGNFNDKSVKASIDLPEFDGFSVRASVYHREQDPLRTNPVGGTVFTLPPPAGVVTTSSGFDNIDENGGRIALRYTGVDDLTVDLKADYLESFDGQHGVQNLGFTSADLTSGTNGFLGALARGSFGNVGPYVLSLTPTTTAQKSIPSWFDFNNVQDKAGGVNLTAQYDLYDNLTLKSISGYRSERFVGGGQDDGGTALLTPASVVPGLTAAAINRATQTVVPGGFYANTAFSPAGTPFCYSICSLNSVGSLHTISEELQAIGHDDHFDWIAGFFYFDEIAYTGGRGPEGAGAIPTTGITQFPGGFLGTPSLLGAGLASADNQSWAFYGHTTVHLNDVVDFSGGIRYTYDYRYYLLYNQFAQNALTGTGLTPFKATSKSFDNVDWDVSLTWKIMPDVNAYAKVSTGYLSGGTVATGPFDPINLTSYELGVKSEWFDHRLRFDIDGWHTKQTDTQISVLNLGQLGLPAGTPLGGVIQSNPMTHVSKNGVEIETLAVPLKGLTFGFNIGFISSTPTLNLSSGIPTTNIGLTAEYDFPRFDNDMYVAIRADSTWTDSYTTGNLSLAALAASAPALVAAVTRPATWILDLRATLFDIPLGPVKGKVSAWVKNLTDEQNLTYAIDLGVNVGGTFDPPRTYGVDLAIDF